MNRKLSTGADFPFLHFVSKHTSVIHLVFVQKNCQKKQKSKKSDTLGFIIIRSILYLEAFYDFILFSENFRLEESLTPL